MIEIEKELIELVKRGDRAAFKRLYDLSVDAAYGTSLKVLGKDEDAEEAVQNAYIKIFYSIKDFDVDKEFSPWFYKLVMNSAIDLYRSRKSYFSRLKQFVLSRFSREEEASFSTSLEKRQLIEKSLEKLSEEDRRIMLLSGLEGMSYKQISEITGSNINTIKTRIRRLRQRLGA